MYEWFDNAIYKVMIVKDKVKSFDKIIISFYE